MIAIRLQNMSVTSSRAAARSTWIRLASRVSLLASVILTKSSTVVVRASPAKCPIFPGGIPVSHCSVGPNASSHCMCSRRCLNFVRVTAFGGSFSLSKPLRLVAGSTTIN
jgi:hypothetical protein